MTTREIRTRLRRLGNKKRAKLSQRYFKTGPGEYGEGDIFLGITAPVLRTLAKEYQDLALADIIDLLRSAIHEERLLALLLLVRTYARADVDIKRRIYELYLQNTRYINNWDLVDLSAMHIVGTFLMGKSKKPLHDFATSNNMWERRIAVMATFYFIKGGEFAASLTIARKLLTDKEDLIHKAVGWMLREIGKRNLRIEEQFLKKHYQKMPRTMLRYAIEKFPEAKRQRYLKGKM
ncbi:MAG: DNA alkylation repair protein [Deltaproteobacteria bacterium RBG_16_54_18]|nr:MAG: DNA alkylation repair protein [Deltaproteobacteria bacterium RBG_16_54_18]